MQTAGDIINREVLEVEFPNLNTALNTEQELRDLMNNVVPDLVYESYLKYFDPDTSLRIGKLHLDLGEMKLQGLSESFIESIIKELDKEFSAIAFSMSKSTPETNSYIDVQEQSSENEYAPHTKTEFEDRNNNCEFDDLVLIKHYLVNGTLPWWADRQMEINFYDLLKNAEKSNDLFPSDLLLGIMQNEITFNRFINNLRHAELRAITEQLISSFHPGLKETEKLLLNEEKITKSDLTILFAASVIGTIVKPNTFLNEYINFYSAAYALPKITFIKNILIKIFNSEEQFSTQEYKAQLSDIILLSYENNINMKELFRLEFFNDLKSYPEFIKYLKGIFPELKSKIGKEQINFLEKLLAHPKSIINNTSLFENLIVEKKESSNHVYTHDDKTESRPHKKLYLSELVSRLSNLVKSSPEIKKKSKELKIDWEIFKENEIKDVKHFISNAGLCLLIPFLPQFFIKLNLTPDGNFTSKESQKRAVRILQYIVDNKNNTGEHLLQFNKLLCGLPINFPIDISFEINNNEIEEIEILLKSVISHWSALKNTSVEGFRRAFLLRDGALMEDDDGWSLRVERKSQDVLLETIPWNYVLIKYKWMENLIRVEW